MAAPAVPRIQFLEAVTSPYLRQLERVGRWWMGGGTDGRPVLRLGANEPQELDDDADETLLWNVRIFDNVGMWDEGNPGQITIPEDGIYLVLASCAYFGNATGYRAIWAEVDGIVDGGDDDPVSGSTTATRHYQGLVLATAGSVLEIKVRQNSGGALNTALDRFNPRLHLMWLSRIFPDSPAYEGSEETQLPQEVSDAIAGIQTQITILQGQVAQLLATVPPPPPEPAPGGGGGAVTAVVRINCGGPAYIQPTGVAWEADRGYVGGEISLQGAGRSYGTERDTIFFSERWGAFTYSLPQLPPGPATVRLHFAENHPPTDSAGERVFDVTVNGVLALNDYDIFAEAGGAQYTPVVEEISTTIDSDGICEIQFSTTGSTNNAACVQGIEILCEGTGEVPEPDDTPPPAPTGFWYSGFQSHTIDRLNIASAMRQRICNLTLTYTTRNGGWDQLVLPSYATEIAGPDKNMVVMIAQPFTPDSFGGNGAQARAINTGAYDAQWRRWGETLKNKRAQGYPEYLTNLCWEFNGNWYRHSAVNAAEFVAAWRRVVSAVRSVHPTAKFVWTVNAGYSHNPPSHDARDCWPGDDYVDYVGIDAYDHHPRATPNNYAGITTRENTVTGRLKYWADFARAHDKKLILQEWGVNNTPRTLSEGAAGGDSADYIQWIWDWCNDRWNAGELFGECYFAANEPNNIVSDIIYQPSPCPNARAKYIQLWTPSY